MIYKSISDARAQLTDLVDQSDRVTLTRNGQPVAVLLNIDDYRSVQGTVALARNPALLSRLIQAEAEPITGFVDSATPLEALVARNEARKTAYKRPPRRALAARKVK